MTKRHTTMRLSKLTDYQIGELSDKWQMTATEVIALAVDRLHRVQRWGLPAEQMGLSTLLFTALHDRLDAGALPVMERTAALAWCQRWLAANTDPNVLEFGSEHWQEAAVAADAAVAAWEGRNNTSA